MRGLRIGHKPPFTLMENIESSMNKTCVFLERGEQAQVEHDDTNPKHGNCEADALTAHMLSCQLKPLHSLAKS